MDRYVYEVVEDTEAATEVVSEVEEDRMAMLHTEPGEGQLVLTCRVYTDSYNFRLHSQGKRPWLLISLKGQFFDIALLCITVLFPFKFGAPTPS